MILSLFLLTAIISDMGLFGRNYLPLISSEASVIPKKTESISFIKSNTNPNEKIIGLGGWTFYASTNIFYDIRDIRWHSFVFTNPDIMNLYEAIDETSYPTPTRVAFNKIDNENL